MESNKGRLGLRGNNYSSLYSFYYILLVFFINFYSTFLFPNVFIQLPRAVHSGAEESRLDTKNSSVTEINAGFFLNEAMSHI